MGTALLDAVSRETTTGHYPIGGQVLKRIPQGYGKDHPRAEWLQYKGLHVFAPTISLEFAAKPALISIVMEHFSAMSPIWSWLIECVD